MDRVTDEEQRARIKIVMEEIGVDEEAAAFAVALADRKGKGDVRAITFPLPEDEAHRQADQLVHYLGFTPDEAARCVAGDRTAIEEVAARRLRANERDLDTTESRSRTARLSAD